MGHFRLPDPDRNFRQPFADFPDPLMTAQGGQRRGDDLVKRAGGDIERMGNVVNVVERNRAGPQRH